MRPELEGTLQTICAYLQTVSQSLILCATGNARRLSEWLKHRNELHDSWIMESIPKQGLYIPISVQHSVLPPSLYQLFIVLNSEIVIHRSNRNAICVSVRSLEVMHWAEWFITCTFSSTWFFAIEKIISNFNNNFSHYTIILIPAMFHAREVLYSYDYSVLLDFSASILGLIKILKRGWTMEKWVTTPVAMCVIHTHFFFCG